jgi:hypothetical protein
VPHDTDRLSTDARAQGTNPLVERTQGTNPLAERAQETLPLPLPLPDEVPAGLSVGQLLRLLMRHPWHHLGRRWNYKSAVTSSFFRGLLFFSTNVTAGLPAALGALSTEFWFRFLTAGYYGALTQAFRRVEPPKAAMIGAMIVLPIIGHGLEFLVHWLRSTPNLSASIGVSVFFTVFSTSFNLFAMRHGALITGNGSTSLWQDLRRMPALLGSFALWIVGIKRRPRSAARGETPDGIHPAMHPR